MLPLVKGLWIFIKERFSPSAYLPMIALFTLMNALWAGPQLSGRDYVLSFLLMLSAFFRLRCFDEIKDYQTDLAINPDRPLPRGVLSLSQVKFVIASLILFEVGLCAFVDSKLLMVHAVTLVYSILMYKEFFIGEWLRPRLTTYAVSHTFVSVLMATSVLTLVESGGLNIDSLSTVLFLLSNWCFFNLFEFARKSFAADEERSGVDSYTSLFGVGGALVLCLSQVFLGLSIGFRILLWPASLWLLLPVIVIVPAALYFVIKKTGTSAKIFRNMSGLYLLAHYLMVSILLMGWLL